MAARTAPPSVRQLPRSRRARDTVGRGRGTGRRVPQRLARALQRGRRRAPGRRPRHPHRRRPPPRPRGRALAGRALQAAGVRVEHRSLIDPSVPAIATADLSTPRSRSATSRSSSRRARSSCRSCGSSPTTPTTRWCSSARRARTAPASWPRSCSRRSASTTTRSWPTTRRPPQRWRSSPLASRPRCPTGEPLGPRIMSAEAATMEATLDWLRATHGGAEAYLLANGLTPPRSTLCACAGRSA